MFQHLDFLLENSNILLSRPSLRGSTPLAVAESSVMENPELALALRENYMEKIAVYLSKCGFQSNQDLLDKGYPDIGWDPVEVLCGQDLVNCAVHCTCSMSRDPNILASSRRASG